MDYPALWQLAAVLLLAFIAAGVVGLYHRLESQQQSLQSIDKGIQALISKLEIDEPTDAVGSIDAEAGYLGAAARARRKNGPKE